MERMRPTLNQDTKKVMIKLDMLQASNVEKKLNVRCITSHVHIDASTYVATNTSYHHPIIQVNTLNMCLTW